MKLFKSPPKTLSAQITERHTQVWLAHPECQLSVGQITPVSEVRCGKTCVVMIAKGPLMVHRGVPTVEVRWLFDCFGGDK